MGPARRRALARRRDGRIPRRKRRYTRRRQLPTVGARGKAIASLCLLLALAIAAVLVFVVFRKPDTQGARVVHFTVDSPLVHGTLTETAVIPAGSSGAGRPLLVFLHGEGVGGASLDESMFKALAKLGARAPDIVFPGGGEDSYWHNRKNGDWGSYVIKEVLPQAIALLHANPRRVAIGGISMGGFGAFDLARLYPHRFCAVGGHSPALWLEGGETPQGAFEDAEDFARNNVIGDAVSSSHPYPGAKLWIDVGTEDPFRSADTTFMQVLRAKGEHVQFHVWPGGHEQSYWASHWGSYLDFYASALASCHEPPRRGTRRR